ncbi:hypothetical protein ND748_28505 [Frankia sp. AiPs1]|uniref:hypothetical protein n=1 Tax=Frankia sp. AiPs1 TaxID=573493 RepID=UPI002042DA5B|nr:hypothetical protein [Frankia sp. AiPs1]MCM3925597.1 hypothetical protein [Frankia sp. AiPs1]
MGGATTWFRWDPDRVAAAVAACPEVARLVAAPTPAPLHIPACPRGAVAAEYLGADAAEDLGADDAARGRFEVAEVAEVATYLPGRRVAGVRVRADRILVQVDCRYGKPLADLAGRIRAAVLHAAPDCPRVDVIIRDLDLPDGPASNDQRVSVGPPQTGNGGGPPQTGNGGAPSVWPP